jgi:hypothetical protein
MCAIVKIATHFTSRIGYVKKLTRIGMERFDPTFLNPSADQYTSCLERGSFKIDRKKSSLHINSLLPK